MHKKNKYIFLLLFLIMSFTQALKASLDEKFPDSPHELAGPDGELRGEPDFNIHDGILNQLGQTPFASPLVPLGSSGSRLQLDHLRLNLSGDQNNLVIEPIIINSHEHSWRPAIKAAGLLGIALAGIIKYNQEAKKSMQKFRTYAQQFWREQKEKPLTRGFIARTICIFAGIYYLYN